MNHEYVKGVSRNRKESNDWLEKNLADIKGDVLSIGSGDDMDGASNYYRDYFPLASSYTTSDFDTPWKTDIKLDVRDMKEIPDERYDCLFISGVLEHVDDIPRAVKEIKRVLKKGGTLIVGVPFRQAIHAYEDYWRFTKYGIEYLFKDMDIQETYEIGAEIEKFPSAYWMKANK